MIYNLWNDAEIYPIYTYWHEMDNSVQKLNANAQNMEILMHAGQLPRSSVLHQQNARHRNHPG